MDRNDLILYFENLRNLETLKYCAIKNVNMYDSEIKDCEEKIKEKDYTIISRATRVSFIISFVLVVLAIVSFCCAIVYSKGLYNGFLLFILKFMLPVMFIIFSIVIPSCSGAFSDFFQTLSWKKQVTEHNKNVNFIKPQILEEIEKTKNQKAEMMKEVQEINKLLVEAYAFNLVPLQFRTLPYVIYIHDYMVTSQQTLESAFLHSHIEEAVTQITARLDAIVMQNLEMIRLLRNSLSTNAEIASKLNTVASDIRLNTYLAGVNNYYLRSNLF